MKGSTAAICLLLLAAPAAAQQLPPASYAPNPQASDIRRVPGLPLGEMQAPDGPLAREDQAKLCIATADIISARIVSDTELMLELANGHMVAMGLAEECPGLSFHKGFYFRRDGDGFLCAGRDQIMTRSGLHCSVSAMTPMDPEQAAEVR